MAGLEPHRRLGRKLCGKHEALRGYSRSSPQDIEEGGEVCVLSNGDDVNFYQVIPLYREEIDFKLEHGADALLERMPASFAVVDPARPSLITEGDSGMR